MLAALLVALIQASAPCSGCSTEGKDVRLCTFHADEERAIFASAGKRLGSKQPLERAAGLEELAQLTHAHPNAPSRRVAERLVSALDDESFTVRTKAAELLGPPQNAQVALTGLLRAFQTTEAERERLEKDRLRIRKKQVGPPRPRDSQLADLKRDETECNQQMDGLLGWRSALLDRLASFPDDRVIDAILERTPRGLAFGCNEALVQLGTKRALRAVVESVRIWEEELAELEKSYADIELASARYDELLRDAIREVFQEDLERKRAEGKAHQSELIRWIGERGLGPAPEASERPLASWERWLAEHVDALPERLPGVSSPVW